MIKYIYLTLLISGLISGFSINTAAQKSGQRMRSAPIDQSGVTERRTRPTQVLSDTPTAHGNFNFKSRQHSNSNHRLENSQPRQLSRNYIGVDVWEHAVKKNQPNQNRNNISISVDPMTDTPERLKVYGNQTKNRTNRIYQVPKRSTEEENAPPMEHILQLRRQRTP